MIAGTRRVAVVTGGTGALGQAIVRRLLDDGCALAVPYIVDDEQKRLAASLPAGAPVTLERCDLTDDGAVGRFVDGVARREGRLDVLVTAAGGFAGGRLVETDRATWDHMLATNLTSLFAAARAAVPHMIARRSGRVVAVASRAVLPPAPGFIAYTVAKAGVVAFTQALAQEVRAAGVTVNAVAPSTMDTPANRAAMPDADRSGWVPVDAVAEAIRFLASEAAGYVTGTLLAI